MRRYDFCICTAEGCDCHMREDSSFGRYYLVEDVERETIPRPTEEEAENAIAELLTAAWGYPSEGDGAIKQKRAALLKMLGVSVQDQSHE